MNMRNLAFWWPLLVLKPKPNELKVERQEWNQEEEHFQNGFSEPVESPREKIERLSPEFGNLKRLVL